MKDAIQVVLVDPLGDSREATGALLAGLDGVALVDRLASYDEAAALVAASPPRMLVVAVDADPAAAAALIRAVVRDHPGVAVLPAGRAGDSAVVLQVVRAGAREFLALPAKADDLRETVRRLVEPAAGTAGDKGLQMVAVTGTTGGVGCTTLAVNLATTLAKIAGHEVVLSDFDLMLGSLDACLDIVSDQTIQGVVQHIDRLDLTLLKRSLTRHASGLYVLPHPAGMDDAARLDPEALRRVLDLLKSAFPAVVVDTSKSLQSSDFVAFESADVILVTVQLEPNCLQNTARLLRLFRQFDGFSERVRVVVNRAGSHASEVVIKAAEDVLETPISWQIPNGTKTVNAARAKGVPVDEIAPGGRVHQAFLEIARAIRPPTNADPVKPRRGLFAALF